MRKYYTLVAYGTEPTLPDSWEIVFGDYDRETVEDELRDCEEHGFAGKIIVTSDQQADINEAVYQLNYHLNR